MRSRRPTTAPWSGGLQEPFPLLPHFLSKMQPQPVMMPERMAATDPFKQVTEIVGSGPFRFLPDEYVSGAIAAFAKFDRYVPRQEPPSYNAGGHKCWSTGWNGGSFPTARPRPTR